MSAEAEALLAATKSEDAAVRERAFTAFGATLLAIGSGDGAVRARAEALLGAFKPDELASLLAQTLRTSPDEGCRTYAAVLLRQNFERTSGMWAKLPPPVQAQIKQLLLEVFISESVPHLLRKACHTIAELASTCKARGEAWPELLPCTITACKDAVVARRFIGLTLLRRVLDYVGSAAATDRPDLIGETLVERLSDAEVSVRGRAFMACVSFIRNTPDDRRDRLSVLIDPMLAALQSCLGQSEPVAREALNSLLELTESIPTFLRPGVEKCLQAMLAILKFESFSNETRSSALELVLSLAEEAPDMLRRFPETLKSVLEFAATCVYHVADNPRWVEEEDKINPLDDEDTRESELIAIGDDAFDRLARGVGGRIMTPLIMDIAGPMMVHKDDWRQRRAGCMIFSLAAEGCGAFLMESLEGLVKTLAGLVSSDSHPRVRYMAVHTLGQLCEDLGQLTVTPSFHDVTYQIIPPVLIQAAAKPDEVLRTRAHAVASLCFFTNRCKPTHFPDLARLCDVIFDLLKSGSVVAVTQCMVLCASLSIGAKEKFVPFVGRFLEVARSVLAATPSGDTEQINLMMGRCVESLGIMASILPVELIAETEQVMKFLVNFLSMDKDSESYNFLLMSLAHTAEALGDTFAGYRDLILAPILESAAADIPVKTLECDSDDDGEDDDEDIITMYIPEMGKRKVSLDSVAVKRKQVACKALFHLLDEAGPVLMPRIDDIAKAMSPVIKYQNAEHARTAAYCCVNRLMSLALADPADPEHGQKMLALVIQDLVEGLVTERNFNVLCTGAEVFDRIMKACVESGDAPRAGIDLAQLEGALKIIQTLLEKAEQRRIQAKNLIKENHDFDEDDMEAFQLSEEAEDELATSLVDSVTNLMKLHGEDAMPALSTTMLPYLRKALELREHPALRSNAVACLTDCVEHCAPASHPVLDILLPHLEQCLEGETHPMLRQAAAYGLGISAVVAAPKLRPRLAEALRLLTGVVVAGMPDDEEEGAEEIQQVHDNAVASLVRILTHMQADIAAMAFDVNIVLKPIVLALPLQADQIEAVFVHQWAVSAMREGGAIAAILPPDQRLLKLVEMTHAHAHYMNEFEEALLNDETVAEVRTQIRAAASQPALQSVLQSLPAHVAEPVMSLIA